MFISVPEVVYWGIITDPEHSCNAMLFILRNACMYACSKSQLLTVFDKCLLVQTIFTLIQQFCKPSNNYFFELRKLGNKRLMSIKYRPTEKKWEGNFLLPAPPSLFSYYEWQPGSPRTSNGHRFPCPTMFIWLKLFHWKQGSGPGRGQSPVEWGDILSVCLSIRPPGPSRPSERPGGPSETPGGPSERPGGLSERPGGLSERPGELSEKPGGPSERPGGPCETPGGPSERPGGPSERPGAWKALKAPGGTDRQTDRHMDGFFPHSTALRPLPGPLPKNWFYIIW